MASASRQWKSRDEIKKEKELQEARKAGTVAPETDAEGNIINPHIPQYIAQAPWYISNEGPSLKHQRIQQDKKVQYDKAWYVRGTKLATAKKFRKGACTNCGAMTHDAKPDEVVQELLLDYDGKRDRWNGYDPSTHNKVKEAFDQLDQERRKKKAEQMSNFMTEPDPEMAKLPQTPNVENKKEDKLVSNDSDQESDDEFKEKEGANNAPVSKVDPRTRSTIRNLRIREDKAKYLMNLDLNSAYYDPKTRSMRENPNPNQRPEDQIFRGDNFVRSSGDATRFNNFQSFAWEAYEKGQELHMQAAPSQAELLFEQYKVKKQALEEQKKAQILDKYGGAEHLDALPKELIYAQSETYIEYARDGSRIKKGETTSGKSRYEEDVYINNHTSVWGSYWDGGEWGFACCHQLVKNSYCTGEAGIVARSETPQNAANAEALLAARHKKVEDDYQDRLKAALKKEEERQKNKEEKDERKRGYNSLSGIDYKEPSQEEYEAYLLKRVRSDDPMRDYLGKD